MIVSVAPLADVTLGKPSPCAPRYWKADPYPSGEYTVYPVPGETAEKVPVVAGYADADVVAVYPAPFAAVPVPL